MAALTGCSDAVTTLRLLLPLLFISVSFPVHGQLPSAVVPPVKPAAAADLNRDGLVNMADVALLRSALGNSGSDAPYDLNGDGTVSLLDLFILADAFERGSPNAARRRSYETTEGPIQLPPDASYTAHTDPLGRTTVHTETYDITIHKGEPFGIISLRLTGQAFDFAHTQLPLADWEWFSYHRPAYEPLLQRKLLQEIWEGPEAVVRADGIALTYRMRNVLRIGVDLEVVFHLKASDASFDVEYTIHNGAAHALQIPYAMVGFPGFSNHRQINKVTAAGEVRRPQAPHGNFQAEADARGLEEYGLLRHDADSGDGEDQLRASISIETPDQTYRLETSFLPPGEMTDVSIGHTNKPLYLTSHLYASMEDLEPGRSRSFAVAYRLSVK